MKYIIINTYFADFDANGALISFRSETDSEQQNRKRTPQLSDGVDDKQHPVFNFFYNLNKDLIIHQMADLTRDALPSASNIVKNDRLIIHRKGTGSSLLSGEYVFHATEDN